MIANKRPEELQTDKDIFNQLDSKKWLKNWLCEMIELYKKEPDEYNQGKVAAYENVLYALRKEKA